jgi:hypothetical protein
VAVVQDWWSAATIGYLNDWRLVIDLDGKAGPCRNGCALFVNRDSILRLGVRRDRCPVRTPDDERNSGEWQMGGKNLGQFGHSGLPNANYIDYLDCKAEHYPPRIGKKSR